MKLEVDLIREILLWCEENIPVQEKTFETSEVNIDEYTQYQITIHFALLIEKGYIKALDASGGGWNEVYMLDRLTFDGYQYLEAIKSDTIWKKYKEVAKSIGMQAVQFALPILADVIKKQYGLN